MVTRKLESLQLSPCFKSKSNSNSILFCLHCNIHSPLHLAVLQGFIEVVFSLVRILPDPRLLEIPNKMLQVSALNCDLIH